MCDQSAQHISWQAFLCDQGPSELVPLAVSMQGATMRMTSISRSLSCMNNEGYCLATIGMKVRRPIAESETGMRDSLPVCARAVLEAAARLALVKYHISMYLPF